MISEEDFLINLSAVREKMADACSKCGRSVDEVKLLPVTKNWPVAAVQYCKNAGFQTVGENRVQEAREKQEVINGVNWELIGHLQSNKVNQVVGAFSRIQTLDSLKIIRRIDMAGQKMNIKSSVLLQVNTGNDPAKFGFHESEVEEAMRLALNATHLQVDGLMTIAPYVPDDLSVARNAFEKLAHLRDILEDRFEITLPELSMGMSEDLFDAISAGSTMIRVGSALWGQRT